MNTLRTSAVIAAACLAASTAHAQPVIPNDFEVPAQAFSPLFSYFGGVQSFGVEPSLTTIYSGRSLQVQANFRHDNLFRVAGFAVGTLGITRAPGTLNIPPDAAFFSITIAAPQPAAPATYTSGQLRLIVALREDDNGDGLINAVEDDDQWESAGIPVLEGTHVYNIPVSELLDSDPAVGDGVQEFATTGVLACLLTFETRTTYPGGILEAPRSLLIDHVGLYAAAQTAPTTCAADIDGSGAVTLQDLFAFLALWFSGDAAADFSGDQTVSLQDVFAYLESYFTGCP